jgi:septin family protein
MKYLIIFFIIIIIVGLLANRELARDKERIKQMMREYSFRTYSPQDEENNSPEKEN